MKLLCVHPGPLMYTKVFLRLEPLGLELVAAAARQAGHEVALIDLQLETHADFESLIKHWRPDMVAFSCNYLANVPEVVDLAKLTRASLPRAFVCVGGHSASFTARAIIEHGEGAIDCVLKGEGEASIVSLMEAVSGGDRAALLQAPGVITADGDGPPPRFVENLDDLRPARDLLRNRHKYFIGELDPAASIEFSRGCPWDCSFCSAWTFYGRSYRQRSPERIIEDLESIREPGVFIVDDVAFVHDEHGFAIGEAIARKGIRKQYYLETRGDVLLRHKDVFRFWAKLGVSYIFLGIEALDEEGLKKYRKRIPLGQNFEALEFARSLGVRIVINIIADPDWDEARFAMIRDWCMEMPEYVSISVNTPYPGTESWITEQRRLNTRDYRLFDVLHAVMPTKLPLDRFYGELVRTQNALYKRHFWKMLPSMARNVAGLLVKGQTNYLRGMMLYTKTVTPEAILADHQRPVRYLMPTPPPPASSVANAAQLYIHPPRGRRSRQIDDKTEGFVDMTRMGSTQ
jgi:hopanoid C-3 methylase HpnR